MLPAFSPDEIDQLQRAAQMFEMILDTGAPSDEAYETLKDVYDKLRMPDEYRRVTARFADYLLARDDRDAGIAQLVDLAERHPHEPQWRERLGQLGVSPPVSDTAPAPDAAPDRDAIDAFNHLKQMAEERATDVIRGADGEDLSRAIGEAEKILSEFDQNSMAGAPEPELETVEVDPVPEAASGDEANESGATPDRVPAPDRASAQHVVARPHVHATGSVEKEYQKSLRLGEMLVEQGVITRDNLQTALDKQRGSSLRIGRILIELGYATEEDVLNCLALQAGVPYLPLAFYEVQPEVVALLPAEFAQRHCVLPVDEIANSVLVTIAAPLSQEVRAELESLLGARKVNYYISEQSVIEQKLSELYPRSASRRPEHGEA